MLDQYFVAIQVEGSWELVKVRPPSPSYKLNISKKYIVRAIGLFREN